MTIKRPKIAETIKNKKSEKSEQQFYSAARNYKHRN